MTGRYLPEHGVEQMQGQTHDVVETAADSLYAYTAYPFLNTVGSGLVEGAETVNVCVNLEVGEMSEIHFCRG